MGTPPVEEAFCGVCVPSTLLPWSLWQSHAHLMFMLFPSLVQAQDILKPSMGEPGPHCRMLWSEAMSWRAPGITQATSWCLLEPLHLWEIELYSDYSLGTCGTFFPLTLRVVMQSWTYN